MTETAFLLACLCILLGVAAWAYRCEFLLTTEQYNDLLRYYEDIVRKHREQVEMPRERERIAWNAYIEAFRTARETDKARIAAEEHVKDLRSQIEELQARLEAAERAKEDTEIYTEEGGGAQEAGTVQAENGPGEMVGGCDGCAIARHASER